MSKLSITVEGKPKDIAALVVALQEQPKLIRTKHSIVIEDKSLKEIYLSAIDDRLPKEQGSPEPLA